MPRVTGYGEVAAQRSCQGLAEVGGTIVQMGPRVQLGRVVREGELLFEVDPEELELEKRRTVASAKAVRAQIATFEFDTGGGNFKAVSRESYNDFVDEAGFGPGPRTFRGTEIYGNTITDVGVPLQVGDPISGTSQFPPCE